MTIDPIDFCLGLTAGYAVGELRCIQLEQVDARSVYGMCRSSTCARRYCGLVMFLPLFRITLQTQLLKIHSQRI